MGESSLGRKALGNAFHVVDVPRFAYINHPAWLVLDHHFLSRYGLAGHRPPAPTPDWIIKAPTIARLAEEIDVPAPALQATIERWNGSVAAGADPDFRRGDSHHDRAWGDPAFGGTRQGTLGPIDSPPYYAVRVRCGALGTKGGPRTDTHGRVLDVDGHVVEGLYGDTSGRVETGDGAYRATNTGRPSVHGAQRVDHRPRETPATVGVGS
jgi:hypothetical protein